MKGKFTSNAQGNLLRKGLVVFQFMISVVMICCTLLIFKQLDFIQKKDVGFNREQLLIIPLNDDFSRSKANDFREKLLENTQIKSAALTNVVPAYNSWALNPYRFINEAGLNQQIDLNDMPVGYDFLETMQMKLIAGRNFSREITTDSTQACLVNEAFVKSTGIKNSVGKTIESVLTKRRKLKIIGIVKDFHLYSLHQAVSPSILFVARNPYNLIARIHPQNMDTTLKNIKKTWDTYTEKYPFEPKFLEEAYAKRYETEQKQGQVFMCFSILAIVIACLGILGLAMFAMQQKRKEIGIRKVLGASMQDIVYLFSKDFFSLVIVAILIAFPIAYYFSYQWLESFAYKISLPAHWYLFVLAGVLALLINFLTTLFQALRAASVNPIEVLKEE